jgi:hypothetical protein
MIAMSSGSNFMGPFPLRHRLRLLVALLLHLLRVLLRLLLHLHLPVFGIGKARGTSVSCVDSHWARVDGRRVCRGALWIIFARDGRGARKAADPFNGNFRGVARCACGAWSDRQRQHDVAAFEITRELSTGMWVPGKVSRVGVALALLLAAVGVAMAVYLLAVR